MIEAGINDGDIVVIEGRRDRRERTISSWPLSRGQEATLKRAAAAKGGMRARWEAATRPTRPAFSAHDKVGVQGKLVGLIRKLTDAGVQGGDQRRRPCAIRAVTISRAILSRGQRAKRPVGRQQRSV